MQIDLSKRFREGVRKLPKPRRREIARVIDAVADLFGQPHRHAGLGVRRLRGDYFECRVGLHLRLLFRVERGNLHFLTLGDHDEVRDFIKTV